MRITQFYASPSNPPRGEKALICYGVENASEVRLDPPAEKVWPAMSRCFEVVPETRITYTLTAERGQESVSRTITIQPGPPKVEILEVSINKLEVKLGQRVTVCYKAKNAVAVTIRPGVWVQHDPKFGCIQDQPKQATTYTVIATGGDGNTDTERVTAKVK